MTSKGESLEHLHMTARTDFPCAFSEFLERLEALGDNELRDQIRDYHVLCNMVGSSGFEEQFMAMVKNKPLAKDRAEARRQLQLVEFRLLAIAQHFGMATPLLDWSRSPFVAWYFALREPSACYPTVVAIAPGVLMHATDYLLQNTATSIRETLATPLIDQVNMSMIADYASFNQLPASSHLNDRLQAQQGVLTKHAVSKSLESIVKILHQGPFAKTPLVWKFVLVEEPRHKAMTQLRMMNITGATLFPGLTGAGQLGLDSLRFEEYSAKFGWSFPHGFA